MTSEDFHKEALRNETERAVSYDLRPFGEEQQGAAAWLLGDLVFKLSVNALNKSKALVLLVNEQYQSTSQLQGFVEKLKAAGLSVSVEKHPS